MAAEEFCCASTHSDSIPKYHFQHIVGMSIIVPQTNHGGVFTMNA